MDQETVEALRTLVAALQTIGGLVPASWRPWIDLFFTVSTQLAMLLAAIKGVVRLLPVPNAPDPKAGWGQWVSYWLMYAAEILSFSFNKPVGITAAEVQRSKKFKIPPPMPLMLLAVLCSSCAHASTAQVAAKASNSVHDALALVGGAIDKQCKAAETRVLDDAKYSDDAIAGLVAVRAKCDPLYADYEAARLLQVAMAGALERSEPLAQKALALLAVWQAIADRAQARGLAVTGPPDALRALTGGAL